uniref:Uncharacterized protein n=1 Tax=Crocodylus porosus TaxID=8502 RepID=A0A7M4F684_CROPO
MPLWQCAPCLPGSSRDGSRVELYPLLLLGGQGAHDYHRAPRGRAAEAHSGQPASTPAQLCSSHAADRSGAGEETDMWVVVAGMQPTATMEPGQAEDQAFCSSSTLHPWHANIFQIQVAGVFGTLPKNFANPCFNLFTLAPLAALLGVLGASGSSILRHYCRRKPDQQLEHGSG